MKTTFLALLLLAGATDPDDPSSCKGMWYQMGEMTLCIEGAAEQPTRWEPPAQCGETRGTPWCNV